MYWLVAGAVFAILGLLAFAQGDRNTGTVWLVIAVSFFPLALAARQKKR